MKTEIKCPNCKTIIDVKDLWNVILKRITKFVEDERELKQLNKPTQKRDMVKK